MELVTYLFAGMSIYLTVLLFLVRGANKKLQATIEESRRVNDEFNALVQGSVDFDSGIRYSAEWVRSLGDSARTNPELAHVAEYAPIYYSVADALEKKAVIQDL